LRVALIALYDDRCYGLRCIASHLRAQGHEVWLLCFKRFHSALIPREDHEAWQRATSASFPPVTEAHEEGTVFCPYLHPIAEREWQLLLEKVGAIRPDLIGVTLTTATLDAARELTGRVHRELPGVPVIWGGIHPTVLPEESLQAANMVCVGEGEHVMAELCADPDRSDIAGLWRRKNGRIIQTPLRPLEQNLDQFPFASFGENEWLFDDNQAIELPKTNKPYFRGVYTIMTQRGCPFACSYCLHHVTRPMHRGERYVRRRSVDHVLAECVRRARDFDLPGFGFFDDIFVMNRKWIAEFAGKYPRRVGLPFGGYAYPLVSTEEMLAQLRQAGMIFIGMGVQTGSDYVSREIYRRRYGAEALLELARTADKLGLALNYELLSNCPFERESDCLETLRLILQLPKPLTICIKRLVIFPGLRIATLDKPKPSLPDSTFEFWNQLYLIARHHLIPDDELLALTRDEYLKTNPEIVRALALGLKRKIVEENASRAELDRLAAEERHVTVRSLLRYAKRLVKETFMGKSGR
jgi:radical SAM superfamily enzyme YgiQ (UPF0313 family)